MNDKNNLILFFIITNLIHLLSTIYKNAEKLTSLSRNPTFKINQKGLLRNLFAHTEVTSSLTLQWRAAPLLKWQRSVS